jgi:hypothetical protein
MFVTERILLEMAKKLQRRMKFLLRDPGVQRIAQQERGIACRLEKV